MVVPTAGALIDRLFPFALGSYLPHGSFCFSASMEYPLPLLRAILILPLILIGLVVHG